MSDYIVRATAGNAQIRAFAMTGKALVEKARQAQFRHRAHVFRRANNRDTRRANQSGKSPDHRSGA